MDTTLRYESNNGTVVEFAPSSKYHYTGASLHDYEHQYATLNSRIAGFYADVTEYDLDVVVAGSTADDRNRMVEAFEYDVIAGKPGRLWNGGYYLECYVTESKKDQWWWEDGHMAAKLKVTAESPKWVKEIRHIFVSGETSGSGIDYPHDWSFDYANNLSIQYIDNTAICTAPFRIEASGPISGGFLVKIGQNYYGVDVDLEEHEVLVIDSRSRTIFKKAEDGTKTNLYNKRIGEQTEGSGEYVFEAIPSGSSPITWNASYNFVLTVYDERSEPRW